MMETLDRISAHRGTGALVLAWLMISVVACHTVAPSPAIVTASGNRARNTAREAAAEGAILPKPDRLVTDTAGILSVEDVTALEGDLLNVTNRGLAQMVIYIAPTLPAGEILEDLTLRSANAWRVGRAGVDDGLVIFVFVAERKVRIELGLGLESLISNEAAARVIVENIAPSFRRAAYAEGLRSAVQELSRLLALGTPRPHTRGA